MTFDEVFGNTTLQALSEKYVVPYILSDGVVRTKSLSVNPLFVGHYLNGKRMVEMELHRLLEDIRKELIIDFLHNTTDNMSFEGKRVLVTPLATETVVVLHPTALCKILSTVI